MEMFASSIVRQLVSKLSSVAYNEYKLLKNTENDIMCLKNDYEEIEAVLKDAEENHILDNAVQVWIKHLKYASFDAENVLDELITTALLHQLAKDRGVKHKIKAFLSLKQNKFLALHKNASKVKRIRKQLDTLALKRFQLNLNVSDTTSMGVADEIPNRETSSYIHSSLVFGRNEVLEMVADKICNKNTENSYPIEVTVYSIWGMGGVGKSTLAKLVYNHQHVQNYFEHRCWIHVSQNFNLKEIIKKLLESIDANAGSLKLLDKLQHHLQNGLRGKRFLIIMDDIWVEEDEKEKAEWEELRNTLSCGAEGSVVLITTRSQATSHMMAKHPGLQHNLKCLSKNDSELLFNKLAFAHGRDECDINELEPIGREIVEKCKGLPLAVRTLGSFLWSKNHVKDWLRVRDNYMWELQERNILPALKLSYDSLLPHVKRCLAYCSIFSKDYRFRKDELIPLWVVNDFIPPQGQINLYVLGEDVFDCLVWRSFFIVDTPSCYRVHDLIMDMIQHIMRDDCVIVECGKEFITPDNAVYLRSSLQGFLLSKKVFRKLRLRSLFLFSKMGDGNIDQIFKHVYLRVLFLWSCRTSTLPRSIIKLRYLRYLNLSYSDIEVLPNSMMYLQNLEVLILKYCWRLRKLHKGLRYQRRLQILDTTHCDSLMYLPLGIKQLTSLQRLTKFPIGKKVGAKLVELDDLNLIEGEMEISGIENVASLGEAQGANLQSKSKLSILKLNWCEETDCELAHDEEILEGFKPNLALKELGIYRYNANVIYATWLDNLINLVEISFVDCKKCEQIPPLGKLPKLKVIMLADMDSLKSFHDDDTGDLGETTNTFSSLQELDISGCSCLVLLPRSLSGLRRLSYFQVAKHNGSTVDKLGDSKYLEGELRIDKLENVVDLTQAKSADLKSKQGLSFLTLRWSDLSNREPEICLNDEEVLEGLEPNASLKELTVFYYMGKNFPSWIGNLVNLVKITFSGLKECERIPFRRSTHLRVVNLWDMHCLKCLHDEDSGDPAHMFLGVEVLDILRCPNLVSLPPNLVKLKELSLRGCGGIISLPTNLPSIMLLQLISCDGLLSLPDNIQSFRHLNRLVIYKCQHLGNQYEKEIGEHWPEISHIPSIHIVQGSAQSPSTESAATTEIKDPAADDEDNDQANASTKKKQTLVDDLDVGDEITEEKKTAEKNDQAEASSKKKQTHDDYLDVGDEIKEENKREGSSRSIRK